MPQAQEKIDDMESRVIENIQEQVNTIDSLTKEMEECVPEIDQLQMEMRDIQDFKNLLIKNHNVNTQNIEVLREDLDILKETKIRLEKRIEVIEEANKVMEKPGQTHFMEDPYIYI